MHNILRKSIKPAIMAAVFLAGFNFVTSCDDGSQIGQSVAQDDINIVVDTTTVLSGKTIANDSVLARTVTQVIGTLDAPGYGRLSSDVVAQFMPAFSLDTAVLKVANVDSLKLVMLVAMDAFTGDSLAPMGIEVFRLEKDLQTPMYSRFNPTDYYNPQKPLGSALYNMSYQSAKDSTVINGFLQLKVKLPLTLGRELCQGFIDMPQVYASPTEFAKKVFKGLYIKSSYGSGRIIRVSKTVLDMHYHYTKKNDAGRDTTLYTTGTFFAVTPEVIINNNITMDIAADVEQQIAAGQNIMVAPAGTDVEVVFPARQLLENYKKNVAGLGVINTLAMTIPASQVENKYDIAPPENVLMVLKSKKKQFFAQNLTTDGKTAFLANYDKSSGLYSFTGMREYLLGLKDKEEITDEDVTFVLTPVNVNYETTGDGYYGYGQSVITSITPFIIEPAMAKFNIEGAKIRFVYSTQSIKK